MKMGIAHIVPLASQVIDILEELRPLTGHGRWVFPSHRSAERPMSENAVTVALRSMGYDGESVTGHGFRATAHTLLVEELRFSPDVVEMQLAHAVRDPLGRAYNRTTFMFFTGRFTTVRRFLQINSIG
jgi:integrase